MTQWTGKDKRQFTYVEQSELGRGCSKEEAAEIAGRTVNKQRRKEGRTPNKSTQGTGNSNGTLDDRTVAELRNLAAQKKIAGRSIMRKRELIESLTGR